MVGADLQSVPTFRNKIGQCYYQWRRANWEKFTREVERECKTRRYGLQMDRHVKHFSSIITKAANTHIPRGSRHNQMPTIPDDVAELNAEVIRLAEMLEGKNEPSKEEIQTYYEMKRMLSELLSEKSNHNRNSMIDKLDAGDSLAWKRIRAHGEKKRDWEALVIENKDEEGKVVSEVTNTKDIANLFCKKYTEVPKDVKKRRVCLIGIREKRMHPKYDRPVTMDELRAAIHRVNNNRAPGPDEMLKQLGPTALEYFPWIINRSFKTGYVPAAFRLATIIPLFKGKDLSPNDLSSYRPISLTLDEFCSPRLCSAETSRSRPTRPQSPDQRRRHRSATGGY